MVCYSRYPIELETLVSKTKADYTDFDNSPQGHSADGGFHMAKDPVRELLDLVAVHGFYVILLEEHLGHPIPVPHEARKTGAEPTETSVSTLRRWLAVLDLAITPSLLRDSLRKSPISHETAQALLRYLVGKSSYQALDRDKADFVSSHLYQNAPTTGETRAPAAQSGENYYLLEKEIFDFERELEGYLEGVPAPEVPPERAQLLREFEYLFAEIEDFRTFAQLMDSGIMQKVRDIKQSFGTAFYHPQVMAHCAVYNAVFRRRFDELFGKAAEDIKNFAAQVQAEGASIMSRLEGDITVQHLTEVQEHEVMNQEYGLAHEQFQKISKFKKAVDSKRKVTESATPAVHKGGRPGRLEDRMAGKGTRPGQKGMDENLEPLTMVQGLTNALEEAKLHTQLEALRSFVRAADTTNSSVIPLVRNAIGVSPQEVEMLRVDYGNEHSFRADYANMVGFLLAVIARLTVESEEFKEKQDSAYLWKPHADSIKYMIQGSSQLLERANKVAKIGEARGLQDKVATLQNSMRRMAAEIQNAATLLQTVNAKAVSASS